MATDPGKAGSPGEPVQTGSSQKKTPGLRPAGPSPTEQKERPPRRVFLYGLLAVSLAVGIPYGLKLWAYYRTHESTDDAYVIGDIVPISARVNGTVISEHVEGNQRVEAGQLLARLDPRDFEARVAQAQAAVQVAAARLRSAEIEVTLAQDSTTSDTDRTSASVRAARSALREAEHRAEETRAEGRSRGAAVAACVADVDMLQARLDVARTGFERAQQLMDVGVLPRQQYDEAEGEVRAAEAAWRAGREKLTQARSEVERCEVDLLTQEQAMESARAGVAEARARLAGSRAQHQSVDIKHAQVEVARALLEQAEADVEYAELQLAYTTLRAPAAGVIAKSSLEVGRVVQAGRPLLAIVSLDDVWVEANFKETQLEHMKPGQRATLKVDSYPDEEFAGIVHSIGPGTGSVFSLLPPENATGNFIKVVQRVPVKIVLDGPPKPDRPLRAGMSVIATVTTSRVKPSHPQSQASVR